MCFVFIIKQRYSIFLVLLEYMLNQSVSSGEILSSLKYSKYFREIETLSFC